MPENKDWVYGRLTNSIDSNPTEVYKANPNESYTYKSAGDYWQDPSVKRKYNDDFSAFNNDYKNIVNDFRVYESLKVAQNNYMATAAYMPHLGMQQGRAREISEFYSERMTMPDLQGRFSVNGVYSDALINPDQIYIESKKWLDGRDGKIKDLEETPESSNFFNNLSWKDLYIYSNPFAIAYTKLFDPGESSWSRMLNNPKYAKNGKEIVAWGIDPKASDLYLTPIYKDEVSSAWSKDIRQLNNRDLNWRTSRFATVQNVDAGFLDFVPRTLNNFAVGIVSTLNSIGQLTVGAVSDDARKFFENNQASLATYNISQSLNTQGKAFYESWDVAAGAVLDIALQLVTARGLGMAGFKLMEFGRGSSIATAFGKNLGIGFLSMFAVKDSYEEAIRAGYSTATARAYAGALGAGYVLMNTYLFNQVGKYIDDISSIKEFNKYALENAAYIAKNGNIVDQKVKENVLKRSFEWASKYFKDAPAGSVLSEGFEESLQESSELLMEVLAKSAVNILSGRTSESLNNDAGYQQRFKNFTDADYFKELGEEALASAVLGFAGGAMGAMPTYLKKRWQGATEEEKFSMLSVVQDPNKSKLFLNWLDKAHKDGALGSKTTSITMDSATGDFLTMEQAGPSAHSFNDANYQIYLNQFNVLKQSITKLGSTTAFNDFIKDNPHLKDTYLEAFLAQDIRKLTSEYFDLAAKLDTPENISVPKTSDTEEDLEKQAIEEQAAHPDLTVDEVKRIKEIKREIQDIHNGNAAAKYFLKLTLAQNGLDPKASNYIFKDTVLEDVFTEDIGYELLKADKEKLAKQIEEIEIQRELIDKVKSEIDPATFADNMEDLVKNVKQLFAVILNKNVSDISIENLQKALDRNGIKLSQDLQSTFTQLIEKIKAVDTKTAVADFINARIEENLRLYLTEDIDVQEVKSILFEYIKGFVPDMTINDLNNENLLHLIQPWTPNVDEYQKNPQLIVEAVRNDVGTWVINLDRFEDRSKKLDLAPFEEALNLTPGTLALIDSLSKLSYEPGVETKEKDLKSNVSKLSFLLNSFHPSSSGVQIGKNLLDIADDLIAASHKASFSDVKGVEKVKALISARIALMDHVFSLPLKDNPENVAFSKMKGISERLTLDAAKKGDLSKVIGEENDVYGNIMDMLGSFPTYNPKAPKEEHAEYQKKFDDTRKKLKDKFDELNALEIKNLSSHQNAVQRKTMSAVAYQDRLAHMDYLLNEAKLYITDTSLLSEINDWQSEVIGLAFSGEREYTDEEFIQAHSLFYKAFDLMEQVPSDVKIKLENKIVQDYSSDIAYSDKDRDSSTAMGASQLRILYLKATKYDFEIFFHTYAQVLEQGVLTKNLSTEQEEIALYTHLHLNTNLIDEVHEVLVSKFRGDDKKLEELKSDKNLLFVSGAPGVGKSTSLGAALLVAVKIQEIITGKPFASESMHIFGQTIQNDNTLGAAITAAVPKETADSKIFVVGKTDPIILKKESKVDSNTALLNILGAINADPEKYKHKKAIIVDEGTFLPYLNPLEDKDNKIYDLKNRLNEVLNNINSTRDPNNQLKIIVLGDPRQNGYTYKGKRYALDYSTNNFTRSKYAILNYRSFVPALLNLLDTVKNGLKTQVTTKDNAKINAKELSINNKQAIWGKTSTDTTASFNNHLGGVYLTSSAEEQDSVFNKQEIVDDILQKFVNEVEGFNLGIILPNQESERKKAMEDFQRSKLYRALEANGFLNEISDDFDTATAGKQGAKIRITTHTGVQGDEFTYAIGRFTGGDIGEEFSPLSLIIEENYITAFNTTISRAKVFAAFENTTKRLMESSFSTAPIETINLQIDEEVAKELIDLKITIYSSEDLPAASKPASAPTTDPDPDPVVDDSEEEDSEEEAEEKSTEDDAKEAEVIVEEEPEPEKSIYDSLTEEKKNIAKELLPSLTSEEVEQTLSEIFGVQDISTYTELGFRLAIEGYITGINNIISTNLLVAQAYYEGKETLETIDFYFRLAQKDFTIKDSLLKYSTYEEFLNALQEDFSFAISNFAKTDIDLLVSRYEKYLADPSNVDNIRELWDLFDDYIHEADDLTIQEQEYLNELLEVYKLKEQFNFLEQFLIYGEIVKDLSTFKQLLANGNITEDNFIAELTNNTDRTIRKFFDPKVFEFKEIRDEQDLGLTNLEGDSDEEIPDLEAESLEVETITQSSDRKIEADNVMLNNNTVFTMFYQINKSQTAGFTYEDRFKYLRDLLTIDNPVFNNLRKSILGTNEIPNDSIFPPADFEKRSEESLDQFFKATNKSSYVFSAVAIVPKDANSSNTIILTMYDGKHLHIVGTFVGSGDNKNANKITSKLLNNLYTLDNFALNTSVQAVSAMSVPNSLITFENISPGSFEDGDPLKAGEKFFITRLSEERGLSFSGVHVDTVKNLPNGERNKTAGNYFVFYSKFKKGLQVVTSKVKSTFFVIRREPNLTIINNVSQLSVHGDDKVEYLKNKMFFLYDFETNMNESSKTGFKQPTELAYETVYFENGAMQRGNKTALGDKSTKDIPNTVKNPEAFKSENLQETARLVYENMLAAKEEATSRGFDFVLAGHNAASFDFPILLKFLADNGIKEKDLKALFADVLVVDTYQVGKIMTTKREDSQKLEDIYSRYKKDRNLNVTSHLAVFDIEMLSTLLEEPGVPMHLGKINFYTDKDKVVPYRKAYNSNMQAATGRLMLIPKKLGLSDLKRTFDALIGDKKDFDALYGEEAFEASLSLNWYTHNMHFVANLLAILEAGEAFKLETFGNQKIAYDTYKRFYEWYKNTYNIENFILGTSYPVQDKHIVIAAKILQSFRNPGAYTVSKKDMKKKLGIKEFVGITKLERSSGAIEYYKGITIVMSEDENILPAVRVDYNRLMASLAFEDDLIDFDNLLFQLKHQFKNNLEIKSAQFLRKRFSIASNQGAHYVSLTGVDLEENFEQQNKKWNGNIFMLPVEDLQDGDLVKFTEVVESEPAPTPENKTPTTSTIVPKKSTRKKKDPPAPAPVNAEGAQQNNYESDIKAKKADIKRGDIFKFQLDEYQVERVTNEGYDVRNTKTGDTNFITKEDYYAELKALESTQQQTGSAVLNNIADNTTKSWEQYANSANVASFINTFNQINKNTKLTPDLKGIQLQLLKISLNLYFTKITEEKIRLNVGDTFEFKTTVNPELKSFIEDSLSLDTSTEENIIELTSSLKEEFRTLKGSTLDIASVINITFPSIDAKIKSSLKESFSLKCD